MAWDFSTDPEYAAQLHWVEEFVREECEPLDLIIKESHDLNDPVRQALIPPLQKIVKERGLWATHLGPHLGGPGYGQVKLALLNEILGRSECAPIVFGSQAPDSGNSEILAHYGSPELKERYLEPLLDNRIVSCFSMTEPQGGADPKVFTTTAVHDGDEWVINGEKWFSSFAVDGLVHHRHGGDRSRRPPLRPPFDVRRARARPRASTCCATSASATSRSAAGAKGYVRYEDVRVPADHMLGPARRRLRGRPDPARRRPHPPRHAHRRSGPADLRHALRARRVPAHPGRDARATSSSSRRWSPTRGWRSRPSGCSRCRPRGRSTSTTTTRPSGPTSRR